MILFLYDDLDPEQGLYFSNCVSEAKEFLLGKYPEIAISEVGGRFLNASFVDQKLEEYNQSGFLFAAYSHGNSRSLLAGQAAYLQCAGNIVLLKNAFVFTIACKAAIEFGIEATNIGAKAFIGYNDYSYSILDEHFAQRSRLCDNYALFLFFEGYEVGKAVEKAKEYFNYCIDKDGWHPIIKPALVANRDNLVAHGDLNLTISTLLYY